MVRFIKDEVRDCDITCSETTSYWDTGRRKYVTPDPKYRVDISNAICQIWVTVDESFQRARHEPSGRTAPL
jgi:hypothetical protein